VRLLSEKGLRSRFFNFFRSKEVALVNLEGDYNNIMNYLEYYAFDKLLGNHGLGDRLRTFLMKPKKLDQLMLHMNWLRGSSSYNKAFIRRYFDLLGNNVIKISKNEKNEDMFEYVGELTPLDPKIMERLQKFNLPFILAGEDLIDLAIDSIFANQPLGAYNEISVGAIWDSLFVDNYLVQLRVSAIDEGLQNIFDRQEWNILDLGTGNGKNIPHILQNAINLGINVNLTLVEYSPVLMYRTKSILIKFLDDNKDIIKQSGLKIKINYIQQDMHKDATWEHSAFTDLKYDLIFMINMMQNLSQDQVFALFKRINSHLIKSDGFLVIHNFIKGEKHRIFDIIYNVTENYQGLPTIFHLDIYLRQYFNEISFNEQNTTFIATEVKAIES
jgi:SAM-dependent methyltransferase